MQHGWSIFQICFVPALSCFQTGGGRGLFLHLTAFGHYLREVFFLFTAANALLCIRSSLKKNLSIPFDRNHVQKLRVSVLFLIPLSLPKFCDRELSCLALLPSGFIPCATISQHWSRQINRGSPVWWLKYFPMSCSWTRGGDWVITSGPTSSSSSITKQTDLVLDFFFCTGVAATSRVCSAAVRVATVPSGLLLHLLPWVLSSNEQHLINSSQGPTHWMSPKHQFIQFASIVCVLRSSNWMIEQRGRCQIRSASITNDRTEHLKFLVNHGSINLSVTQLKR